MKGLLNLKECNQEEFISSWSNLYLDAFEENYVSRINKKQFSEEDIKELFVWKAQHKLFRTHTKFVDNVIAKLSIVNELKNSFDEARFEEEFGSEAAIWQIFLKHIIQPQQFPIFDQHTYRAFMFVEKGEILELPKNNKKKLNIYQEEYQPFFNQFNCSNKKKIDEALVAFGEFLKAYGELVVGKIARL
ncbi:MAG: hypothetical protein AABX04_03560 [Nanoarchaeota archaeon]